MKNVFFDLIIKLIKNFEISLFNLINIHTTCMYDTTTMHMKYLYDEVNP